MIEDFTENPKCPYCSSSNIKHPHGLPKGLYYMDEYGYAVNQVSNYATCNDCKKSFYFDIWVKYRTYKKRQEE